MKKVVLLLTVVALLGGARVVQVLAPTAEIVVQGMSPQELHELGWHGSPTTGLKIVGKGELVYLSGREAAGEAVFGYEWSLAGPAGSAATLDSTNTEWTTFRPDMAGAYTVSLTLTTASGATATSIVVKAAEYVTVGQVDGRLFPDVRKGQCAGCHSGHYDTWSRTAHGDFFKRAIDGQASEHYSGACINCHTLGFNPDPLADNGGFDDLARQLGWTFPEHPAPGEWARLVDQYPDLARAANIQCESCHGPGSLHKGDKGGIEISLTESVCGQCHEEEPYHRISTQWKNSGHATGHSFAEAGGRAGCADCHSGYGYIAKVDPVSNLSVKTGGADGVSCAVCHDPHENGYDHQLRKIENVEIKDGTVVAWGGTGRVCMDCHQGRREANSYAVVANAGAHFGPHYSNQTDMLAGTNAVTFGRYIPSSTHRDALDDSCVDCHMAPTPGAGVAGHDAIGGHSWAMTTEVDGRRVDNVAACQRCHGTLASFDDIMARKDYDGDGRVESAKAELHGLLEEVGKLLPPYGDPHVVVTNDFTPLQVKAAFNYMFVEEDGSDGMHNFQYAIGLLQVTKDVLTYGVLTPGAIASVKDVPNDQGRQVTVRWTRFGGDGPSDNPIQVYHVWRKLDEDQAAGKTASATASVDVMPLDAVPFDAVQARGAVARFADGLWTVVGSQPAARLDQYAAIVPTLFDSTAAGMRMSTFMVSGHTAVATLFAMSEPATGYSVDNLVPSAPSGLVAGIRDNSIVVRWNELPDPDVDYVQVFRRSGADDFVPLGKVSGTEYVDIAVNPGQTYVYKLVAYDFSGNQGVFSAEVQAAVKTGVEALAGGIPTAFAIEQNYPNPFNPSTVIPFAVPEAGPVRVAVYDVSGKEVAVLVDGHLAPGRYQASWTAADLASGVYFVKMQAQGFVRVRTMMLVK